jgi:hypothetical protein
MEGGVDCASVGTTIRFAYVYCGNRDTGIQEAIINPIHLGPTGVSRGVPDPRDWFITTGLLWKYEKPFVVPNLHRFLRAHYILLCIK